MDENIAVACITQAREQASSGYFSKSFELYLMAFDKSDIAKAEHEAEFRAVLGRLNEVLLTANKMEDIFNNFRRAMLVFPNNMHYFNDIGKYLHKYAFYKESFMYLEKALDIDSTYVSAEKNLNSLKNLLVERWHFRMLNDKIRNDTFRKAIHKILETRLSVLDLGTGTGLLAMYANECRPIIVTGVDASETMAQLADTITAHNDCHLLNIVNKMSTSMHYLEIPGKRSFLVTEMFDAGLFGEHVLQSLLHAWDNLITKDPVILPHKAEFFVIGAKCDYLNHKYQLSSDIKSLLNVHHLNVHILTNDETYDCDDVHLMKEIKYMTEPESVVKVDFNNYYDIEEKLNRTKPYELQLKAVDNGEINIVIGWFNLYLGDNLTITTDPRSENRANAWQQAVFFDNVPKLVKANEIINIDFLLNGGKLTMQQKYDGYIHRISLETLRFLNDSEYLKMITGCMGMACVYLGQIAEMSQTNIMDLCPFPFFGLKLLKRGAHTLICHARTSSDEEFFKEVFKANNIPLTKVTILVGDDWSENMFKDEKYHVIFCDYFEICGDIDWRLKEMAEHLKQNHLVHGGLFMPANVTVIGQLVNSHWLDINNRVYDENLGNFNVAKFINKYEVTQNFCIDFTHLEYTALTEPVELGSCDETLGSEISVPVIKDGHANAVLCWYNVELMEEMNEISTNRKNSFIDGIAFLVNPKRSLVCGEIARVLRCTDPDGSFKLKVNDT